MAIDNQLYALAGAANSLQIVSKYLSDFFS